MSIIKYFEGKEYNDLISVIIPLFGQFDQERTQISIDSLKKQKKVNLQIIVAEQSEKPTFNNQHEISYIHVSETGNEYTSPGFLRNTAAKHASGGYLYNSDGDIVYPNPFYFAEILELIKTGENVALCKPPMRRLPIEDFNNFNIKYKELGLEEAIAQLDMSDEFGARMPNSPISIIPLRKKESGRLKTFLYTSSDFKKYNENKTEFKGKEPQLSTLSVHAGATFMPREFFWKVGGFCKNFLGWGCHDADLQWKLRSICNVYEIPNFTEYQVIHLDHRRGYFNEVRWQENRTIQNLRRKNGAPSAIVEDLKNGA